MDQDKVQQPPQRGGFLGEAEGETMGGLTMKPPGFSLSAGPVQRKEEGDDQKNVELKSGEMTRLGESKPKLIYWPETASSGVTLGIGYDIGGRDAASTKEELIAAGMPESQADKISKGAGKKGAAAQQFVEANKTSIGEIPDAVAEALFQETFRSKVAEAKKLATGKKAAKDGGGNYVNARGREVQDQVAEGTYVMTEEQWDGLHPAMVELIADMKFQGGFYAYDRIAKVNAALIANDGDDLAQFKAVAALFEASEEDEISYMDQYHDSLTAGEDSKNHETFFGQSKADLSRSWRRRNRIRYAFLQKVIQSLEAGKVVTMSGQSGGVPAGAKPKPGAQAFSSEDAVLSTAETAGASLETVRQEDPQAVTAGVGASEKMAGADLVGIEAAAASFKEVGKAHGIPPALLAAIASRESGAGKRLDAHDCGPDGRRSGMMGIDDREHPLQGSESREGNISRAAGILQELVVEVKAKFPAWTPAQQLLGAVTAYPRPRGFVASWDGNPLEGDDYASDTWARARHLAGMKLFSGQDPVPSVTVAKDSPATTGRPALKKGRLIAQSVGKGGVNHPDDVNAVLGRMVELGVISAMEALEKGEEAVSAYVLRYQGMIFNTEGDGLITPGKATETKLIAGVTTKAASAPKKEKESRNPAGKGSPKPNPRKPKQQPRDPEPSGGKKGEPDYASIAERVHGAMFDGPLWGLGTNEDGLKEALRELNLDARHIDKFKRVYLGMYGSDVVQDIRSEHSNTWLWGDELDEALYYLEPKRAKRLVESSRRKKNGANNPEIIGVDTFVSKSDWRSQSPDPSSENKKYQDSEPGNENCKYVAEKMVYRHLYEDLPDDFKRSVVINSSAGKYDYIVGATGLHEYLSVQKEDKSKVKDIVPKKHMKSVLSEANTANLAIDYLSGYIAQGIPVVVGVDHTYNRSLSKSEGKTSSKNTHGYNEGTTDHFVTIVGQGKIDGKRYFQFYDPGTQYLQKGTNEENRLVERSPNVFTASQPWDASKTYTLTMVVLFQRDVKTFQQYVDENKAAFDKLESDYNSGKGDFSYRK